MLRPGFPKLSHSDLPHALSSIVLIAQVYRRGEPPINDVILRGRLVGLPLSATDGFEYYVGGYCQVGADGCF